MGIPGVPSLAQCMDPACGAVVWVGNLEWTPDVDLDGNSENLNAGQWKADGQDVVEPWCPACNGERMRGVPELAAVRR